MKTGDKVVCVGERGTACTRGKVYDVVAVDPDFTCIWPAYVAVIDDNGERMWLHARRFEVVT